MMGRGNGCATHGTGSDSADSGRPECAARLESMCADLEQLQPLPWAPDLGCGEREGACKMLEALGRVRVTGDVLRQCQVVKRVKAFAKHPCRPIAETALAVVAAWKACVRSQST